MSGIEWTDRTWNPIRGCSRVSEGCRNCYAERMAARFSGRGGSFRFFADKYQPGSKWTGKVALVPEKLDEPLRWRRWAEKFFAEHGRRPRVFVNSMSDLFHEGLANEEIAAVFGVMAAAPQHTFQILTKRPERMARWFRWLGGRDGAPLFTNGFNDPSGALRLWADELLARPTVIPLPNVWLGVSVEDQRTADERIPLLLQTHAAVRFVSYEPALGPVDFACYLSTEAPCFCDEMACEHPALDWVIAGGESGPGARPCDVVWIRSAVRQCKDAGVPVFVKQLGRKIAGRECEHGRSGDTCSTVDRKGGDMAEWPEDLRVREFPK